MKKEKNNRKIDISDRLSIEVGLYRGETLGRIASKIQRHPASISREIKNNRSFIRGSTLSEMIVN